MYTKQVLKNGLTTIVSTMPHMESVSLGIWIGVGGRYESEKESGLSHMIEHMLFKGTLTRTTRDLKENIEGIGGSLNGFTSDEATCYMVKVPSNYAEVGIDVLSDMVLAPKFDEAEIEREKFVVVEEIKMYKDQPADHVHELLAGIMWPKDPLGRLLTGTITNVKSFTRQDMIKFREKNYIPSNMAIIAAGSIKPGLIENLAEKIFCGTSLRATPIKASTIDQKQHKTVFSNKNIQQTHIAIGFPFKEKDISEKYPMELLNVILGGNMSSRLFEELREKNGLCYDIASNYKRHSDVSEFVIHAGVDTRKTVDAVSAVLSELKKMKNFHVSDDELKRAKEFIKGQFRMALENTSTRMLWMGDRFMMEKTIPDVEEILGKLDAVGKGDIKKAACKIFRESFLNLAIIGKVESAVREKIKAEIAKL
ncbi:MAG: insulinase family protein [Candidatus Omnitrophica bacterium]|nr:insulinase family protein [Candidatus Omnitrophota bacterium]